MIELAIILLTLGLSIAGLLLAPTITQWRRDRLRKKRFPPQWETTLEKHLPFYASLLSDERRQLKEHIQVFLAEKQFIGCGGLEVTLEMKIVVAAVGCLLLLNRPNPQYFTKLRSILLYPSTYKTKVSKWLSPYVVEETQVARLGESWHRGHLVLSWAQVSQDMRHWRDGHNVILHEFAHQLDAEDDTAAGVPHLPHPGDRKTWADVMTAGYEQLCRAVAQGQKTVIDSYGSTHPAEFFAVVTETFFERPRSLHRHHPQLYDLLHNYYQIDPKQWFQR
ncbi:MAG: M90 family metallopeptidase [Cyanobacteria bacterium P01_F01_bin.53]